MTVWPMYVKNSEPETMDPTLLDSMEFVVAGEGDSVESGADTIFAAIAQKTDEETLRKIAEHVYTNCE
jgi:cell division GTPase FtsZ